MNLCLDETAEWLEADGLGGFAMGTAPGLRTRRYHSLLTVATAPPTGRIALLHSVQVFADVPGEAPGRYSLSSERYSPGVIHPLGSLNLSTFECDPWPTWTYVLDNGAQVRHELFVVRGAPVVCLAWRVVAGPPSVRLRIRPMLSGRDYHSLHHENPDLKFEASLTSGRALWRTYPSAPAVTALHSGAYRHDPVWHRNFLYEQERARGFPFEEDLASPGEFSIDISGAEGALVFAADAPEARAALGTDADAHRTLARLREAERTRRGAFPSRLERAADDYIVARGSGKTIVAGYPWFTDWGRDTFIAIRGLCLATGRLGVAKDILLAWAPFVSEGMLPNRFPDSPADHPEYNSVDASLWFVVAAAEFLEQAPKARFTLTAGETDRIKDACLAILSGYAGGTRFHIRADADGLLRAGEPGVQLTWMDAKIGDLVVTPRIGKPVEVQALWLNALAAVAAWDGSWEKLRARALESFRAKFWNSKLGCLFDVVDANHQPGENDASVRPNQILAVGGLTHGLLDAPQAKGVVAIAERDLWTPLGLRSLSPRDPAYRPRYEGGPFDRDTAYHQGTVWPWLAGPFVEAWVRVRGSTRPAKSEARRRFLEPLLRASEEAGVGHVPEIADAEEPYTARGCPFQAWSVGEALRLDKVVLA